LLTRETITPKILSNAKPVKREIAAGNSPGFQAQIDDLRLKCGILRENPKNKSSGRKMAWGSPKNSRKGR